MLDTVHESLPEPPLQPVIQEEEGGLEDSAYYLFAEFFAGTGVLTSAVSAAGVPVRPPDDLATGGADFEHIGSVNSLREELGCLIASGISLMVHFAPPCSTFSKARGRSSATRLRTAEFPQGLPKRSGECYSANLVACHTLSLVEWLARKGAAVSMENPETSWLWKFLDFDAELAPVDVTFTACMFGAPYQKPTRLRCWNWVPPSMLGKRCTLSGDVFTCGRTRESPHSTLEFGSLSTSDAAEYVPALCTAWASDVFDYFSESPAYMAARREVVEFSHGNVRRHVFRGSTDQTTRERHMEEDRVCSAGCRRPADLHESWPALWSVMNKVSKVLRRARNISSDLRSLVGCCGADPTRSPPLAASVLAVRHELERVFNVPRDVFDWHHASSPWRAELVGTIMSEAGDPDAFVWDWLRNGAPMGLSKDIVPGTHFPAVPVDALYDVAELDRREPYGRNHPSYDDFHGDHTQQRPPAWGLLEEQVNNGFAMLFDSMAAASAYLGGICHPAPLGNVAKMKEDGTFKHRLIQDLRANGVNGAVRLPERQVLPRGIDHGVDLAQLGAHVGEEEDVFTVVLDFKDAFMSIPIRPEEQRFNCAHSGGELVRTRDPIYHGEPSSGHFVVWRTLGFGGRPNPLVFSRAASFSARTAQALLKTDLSANDSDELAPGRLELYVDDPIVSVRATQDKAMETFDVVILWWLVLGLPLSWKKGTLSRGSEVHRWIGIDYTLSPDGAIMRLPPQFVADLLVLLEPVCRPWGSISMHDLDGLIGKAARVAHVVPSAKPFVAGLWGGLRAIREAYDAGLRETSAGRVPCRRLCYAASWMRALLSETEECPLKLERLVGPTPPSSRSTSSRYIEFDASIYGGGAVLRDSSTRVVEYFSILWTDEDAVHVGVAPNDCRHQTFWEFLTLLLTLVTWGDQFTEESVLVLGDNTGALSDALSLKGRGPLIAIARELSWRQARRGWKFTVGHLPSEHNSVSDALSRVADPKGCEWPALALASAAYRAPPKVCDLWLARPR